MIIEQNALLRNLTPGPKSVAPVKPVAASIEAGGAGGAPRRVDEIKLSAQALEVLGSEAARETVARDGARAIVSTEGLSEAEALQIVQPLRSPPPAKGAALFVAKLASGSKDDL